MNNLAIIPARSGSKGLVNKNIKEFAGKPLLVYSIEAAIKSGKFSHVMVSTDSEEYATIAREYGAEVPFLRSEKTASDSASSWDVVTEVLQNYKEMGIVFDTFTLLQPTSPLRKSEDIISAYQMLEEKEAISIVSVCEMEHSPLWCNTLADDFSMDGFLAKEQNKQRQKLPTFYRINGAIYTVKCDEFMKDTNIFRKGCFAYVMSAENSIDIDTNLDFKIAEAIMKEQL